MFFLTAEILQVWRKITKFEKFHLKTGADPGGAHLLGSNPGSSALKATALPNELKEISAISTSRRGI